MSTYPDIYTRRPEQVEAKRLHLGTDDWKDMCDWLNRLGMSSISHNEGSVGFVPESGELVEVPPNWWLVRDEAGKFHVMPPYVFINGFDPVGPSSPPLSSKQHEFVPGIEFSVCCDTCGKSRNQGAHLEVVEKHRFVAERAGEPCGSCGFSFDGAPHFYPIFAAPSGAAANIRL